jgi:hypothetical protein
MILLFYWLKKITENMKEILKKIENGIKNKIVNKYFINKEN